MRFKIAIDLDGVCAAFHSKVKEIYKEEWSPTAWKVIDKYPNLFYHLDVLPDARFGMNAIDNLHRAHNIPVFFLTALPKPTNQLVTSAPDKIRWVREKLDSKYPVYCSMSWERKVNWVSPDTILIDDMKRNIDAWESAGGIGIHHSNWNTSIEKLYSIVHK